MNDIWKEKDNNKINLKKETLKKPKNNLISTPIDFSKQLSFSNNNLIQKQKKQNLRISIPEDNENEDNNYPNNNLINQNINMINLNFLPLSPYNMINYQSVSGSLSTKPDSISDSFKFNNYNLYNKNEKIMTPKKENQSNLYNTLYGFGNNTFINNWKNSTFPYNKTPNNNNINFINFSKTTNLNFINNNLINYCSPKNNLNNKKDNSEFIININDIIIGKEKRTSVRIKNIPDKLKVDDFIKEINTKMGFDNEKNYQTYDCIYLPISKKNNKLNIGYAFINFIKPLCIIEFYHRFNGLKWKNNKECQITFAEKYQGKDELNKHLSETFGDSKKASLFDINFDKIKIRIPIQYQSYFKNFEKGKIEFFKI